MFRYAHVYIISDFSPKNQWHCVQTFQVWVSRNYVGLVAWKEAFLENCPTFILKPSKFWAVLYKIMFFFVLFIACHISSGEQDMAGITWTGDHVFVCWNIGYRLVSNCWKRGCRLLFIITPQLIVFQFSGQIASCSQYLFKKQAKLQTIRYRWRIFECVLSQNLNTALLYDLVREGNRHQTS